MQTTKQLKVLNISHWSRADVHPGERMCDAIRQEISLAHMEIDTYAMQGDCRDCSRNWDRLKNLQQLQILQQASGPLEQVAMAIIGLGQKLQNGIQYIFFVTDSYSQLKTRCIQLWSLHCTLCLPSSIHELRHSGYLAFLLTENSIYFVTNVCELLWNFLSVRSLISLPSIIDQASRKIW